MPDARSLRFARYAWGVLAYTLLVILWGAFVRATGSGAGCGSHWPLCNGAVIPPSPQVKTLIELSHRVTSALVGFLIIGLVVWAFRAFPKGHRVRVGALLSLIFVITEGAIGAALVLFEWVGDDASLGRTLSIALHLNNTFILVAVLTLTAWWAMGHPAPRRSGLPTIRWLLLGLIFGTLLVSTMGAITALGDTLFRPEGGIAISQTFDASAHHLQRLRVYHPLLAVVLGVVLIGGVLYVQRQVPAAQRLGQIVLALYLGQVALGVWNVFLKAPVWMQLVHLLAADLLWIALILFANQALATSTAPEARSAAPRARVSAPTA